MAEGQSQNGMISVFQKLVNHNDDIRRLVEKGYAVGFDSNCLVIRDIPYLDARENRNRCNRRQAGFYRPRACCAGRSPGLFAGGVLHGLDNKPIPNLGGGPHALPLGEAANDVIVERSFSNKPKVAQKFADFFEKIESYVTIISGPATELHGISPYTFRIVQEVASDSVFKFHDTMTSRAEITDLSAKFKNDVVAIIGLGGTGSYLLDFMVKTPVREIRAFDLDAYHVHNAFRSPGRLQADELNRLKTEVFHARYDNFRTGLSFHPKLIDASCEADFEGVTFAFVCVDEVHRVPVFSTCCSPEEFRLSTLAWV